MTTPPFLLKSLTSDQRLRVLALDYVTSSGFVAPEDWLIMAVTLESYLRDGCLKPKSVSVYEFPLPVPKT